MQFFAAISASYYYGSMFFLDALLYKKTIPKVLKNFDTFGIALFF